MTKKQLKPVSILMATLMLPLVSFAQASDAKPEIAVAQATQEQGSMGGMGDISADQKTTATPEATIAPCPKDQDKGTDDDPFHESLRMPGGKYKGQCINSANYRSSKRLTDEEIIKFGLQPDPTKEFIANFHHDKQFWVAIVPYDRIQSAIFQFLPLVGNLPLFHGQLRFHMAQGEPVKLVEQSMKPDRKIIELPQDNDIVFAEYGVRPWELDGAKFSIPKGFVGTYAVSYQMESVSQGTQWEVDNHVDVRQYNLNMDRDTVIKAFHNGITLGTERKITIVYNTAFQSCLNAVFDLLAITLNIDNRGWLTRGIESLAPNVILKKWGLIEKDESLSRGPSYRGVGSGT